MTLVLRAVYVKRLPLCPPLHFFLFSPISSNLTHLLTLESAPCAHVIVLMRSVPHCHSLVTPVSIFLKEKEASWHLEFIVAFCNATEKAEQKTGKTRSNGMADVATPPTAGLDGLVGKRVACVLSTGDRIEGLLMGFDSQFNVSLRDVSTASVYDGPETAAGEPQQGPRLAASIVRGTHVMYVEVCD